jgi:hypothetical protein
MARLRPVPAARHASPATFVHSDLRKCTHALLRQDAHAGLWSPLTVAPTGCSHGEIGHCSFSYAEDPSLCQPTGSSQPTCSVKRTAEATTSTHQPSDTNHTTTCRVTTVCHTHYTLRPPSSFSCSLQRLSNNLRGGEGGDVGATHSKSSASQSQPRNHQLLSNGSVNTYPRRWNSWIHNLLLGKTYNTCFPSGPNQGYIKGDQTRSLWTTEDSCRYSSLVHVLYHIQ